MMAYNSNTQPGQLPPHQQYQQVQRHQQAQAVQASQVSSAQQRPELQGRTRKNRTFSIHSSKSAGSSHKHDTVETHAEKESRRLHSKADPTLAMNEAEPSAVATGEKSTYTSLREIEHLDANGNPISEPDVSNPTRYRWERPLDTIRSFEAAIDGQYNNRRSMYSVAGDSDSRRNSYYYNNNTRYPQEARQQSYMGSSQFDVRQGRDVSDGYGGSSANYNYASGGGGGGGGGNAFNNYNNGAAGTNTYNSGYSGYGGPRPRYNRMASEPAFHQPQYRPNEQQTGVYPGPSGINHRSYETVASGSGSTSNGEPGGYLTDPTSSDNSSIERRQSPLRQQKFPPSDGNNNGRAPARLTQLSNSTTAPPTPPKHGNSILRRPVRQAAATAAAPVAAPTAAATPAPTASPAPGKPEKRKSWLTRKLSRRT